jgi:hypothetical protein
MLIVSSIKLTQLAAWDDVNREALLQQEQYAVRVTQKGLAALNKAKQQGASQERIAFLTARLEKLKDKVRKTLMFKDT